MTTDKSIREIEKAMSNLSELADPLAFSFSVAQVLRAAHAEALEDREDLDRSGKAHLRTFLKVSPLGLAILDLAREINASHRRYLKNHLGRVYGVGPNWTVPPVADEELFYDPKEGDE